MASEGLSMHDVHEFDRKSQDEVEICSALQLWLYLSYESQHTHFVENVLSHSVHFSWKLVSFYQHGCDMHQPHVNKDHTAK